MQYPNDGGSVLGTSRDKSGETGNQPDKVESDKPDHEQVLQ